MTKCTACKQPAKSGELTCSPRCEAFRQRLRQIAIDEYAIGSDDNIEVDEDAKLSVGEDGTWVQAWVFINKEEYDENAGDDMCDTCMRSGVKCETTDTDGKTVCVECARTKEAA